MAGMQARFVDGITIRPLRNGDTATVASVFERLGPASRVRRFCGAKPGLTERELEALSRVDGAHHVLVGYVDGDAEPAALARLVRDGRTAEIAFEVVDAHQRRGVGSVLARELAADARAAGITELRATICSDNPRAISLLAKLGSSFRITWRGGEREAAVGLET
jgi:RimJ/RimL family protein N-acetyltransferase